MFDNGWEKLIYKKNKQINKYPYDWVVSSTNKFIEKKSNLIALDLGSGTGNNINFLCNYGFKKIYAVEASKTAFEIIKKKFKNKKKVESIHKNFNLFNYKKEKYDLILDRGSLTHNTILDINSTLKKINFSLKKDGYFFSVMFSKRGNFKNLKKNTYSFRNITKNKTGLLANFFSKKEIIKLFKDFEIVDLSEVITINYSLKKNEFATWNIICKKNNRI
jgi:SAM-dependent methyltransferase